MLVFGSSANTRSIAIAGSVDDCSSKPGMYNSCSWRSEISFGCGSRRVPRPPAIGVTTVSASPRHATRLRAAQARKTCVASFHSGGTMHRSSISEPR